MNNLLNELVSIIFKTDGMSLQFKRKKKNVSELSECYGTRPLLLSDIFERDPHTLETYHLTRMGKISSESFKYQMTLIAVTV